MMKSHQPINTMIVTQPKTNIVTSGIVNSVSFGIKQEGLAHIFNVLRNQLYSNKIMAVLREYSCNAVDAHTEAGIPDRPIQVTLPNRMSLELKIRDFGHGLSEEDIHNIYAFYGESTKRKSNALIGQLGLGSKSAFAYGDNFVINSFCDGKKTSYNAYIDATQVGQIAKLFSAPSTEENGVEIVIPVKLEDIQQFESTASKVFQYFKVRPAILGASINFNEFKTLLNGDDWKIVQSNGRYDSRCVAIMGNIGYAINADSLKFSHDSEDDESCRSLLSNCSLEIDFNIGDLDIAASREGLQYTDRTIKNIKAKLVQVLGEIKSKFETELASCKSLWSAKRMIGSASDYNHPYHFAARCIKSFNWKNHTKISNTIHFTNTTGEFTSLFHPRKGYVGGSYLIKGGDLTENLTGSRINIFDGTTCIDNSKGVKTGLVNYAFNFLKDGHNVLVFNFRNPVERKAIMRELGMVDSDLVDIKTLQKITLPRNSRSSVSNTNPSVKAKHGKRVFMFDASNVKYTSTQSDYWNETDVDMEDVNNAETMAWIEIDRFVPVVNNVERTNTQLKEAIAALDFILKETNQKVSSPKILGIKKATDKNGKIQHIKDFATSMLKTIEKEHNLSESFARLEEWRNFVSGNSLFCDIVEKEVKKNNPKMLNTIKIYKSSAKFLKDSYDKQIKVYEYFGKMCAVFGVDKKDILTTPLSKELSEAKSVLAEVDNTMRILKYVDRYSIASYRDNSSKAHEAIVDMIESRDAMLEHLV